MCNGGRGWERKRVRGGVEVKEEGEEKGGGGRGRRWGCKEKGQGPIGYIQYYSS